MNRMAPTKDQELASGATVLEFGEFRIDLLQHVLLRDDRRVKIQKKPLAVLTYLIKQAPRMVHREELLDRFWSRTVNEEVLTRCISTIRKYLVDIDDPPRFIETHRAQGYRFIADVSRLSPGAGTPGKPTALRHRLIPAIATLVAALLVAWLFWPARTMEELAVERIGRIAVLPISVTGSDSEWLEPALADHLMHAVSRIEGVTVVTSTTDANNIDVQKHGQELNVEALLLTRLEEIPSGSVLSARLVSVAHGALLWSTSLNSHYEFSSGDQVQKLARQLAVRLRPALQLSDMKPQVEQRAYSYYLQGRYYWAQRSAIGLEAAIAAYDAALDIEPDYTDALLGSAESWLLLPLYGAMPPDEAIPKARQLAERALEHDTVSSRARAVLGAIAMQYDWNWTVAEALLREAVALNPNDATAQQWLGEVFCYTSRFEACRRQLRIAFELDPLSPVLQMQQGSPALYAGDFEAAVALYSNATLNTPEFPMGRYALGLAYAGLGDWNRAIDAYRSSMPDLGLEIVGGPLVFALGQSGASDQAERMLQELEILAGSRYVPPSKIAVAHLGVGDKARALEELWRAVEVRDDRLVYYINDVHFRDLIVEEGFGDVARHIGF